MNQLSVSRSRRPMARTTRFLTLEAIAAAAVPPSPKPDITRTSTKTSTRLVSKVQSPEPHHSTTADTRSDKNEPIYALLAIQRQKSEKYFPLSALLHYIKSDIDIQGVGALEPRTEKYVPFSELLRHLHDNESLEKAIASPENIKELLTRVPPNAHPQSDETEAILALVNMQGQKSEKYFPFSALLNRIQFDNESLQNTTTLENIQDLVVTRDASSTTHSDKEALVTTEAHAEKYVPFSELLEKLHNDNELPVTPASPTMTAASKATPLYVASASQNVSAIAQIKTLSASSYVTDIYKIKSPSVASTPQDVSHISHI